MSENAVESTKTGVLLIIVSALVILALGIFAIGRGLANDGVTSVVDASEIALSSDKQALNQKIIMGAQVSDYIEVYSRQDFAVLVNTIGVRNISPLAGTLESNAASFRAGLSSNTNPYGTGNWAGVIAKAHWALATSDGVNSVSEDDIIGDRVAVMYRNYGSILGEYDGGEVKPLLTLESYEGALHYDGGFYVLSGNFITDGYSTVRDTNTASVKQVAALEYISQTAKFRSNLIITDSGGAVGVCFTQLTD